MFRNKDAAQFVPDLIQLIFKHQTSINRELKSEIRTFFLTSLSPCKLCFRNLFFVKWLHLNSQKFILFELQDGTPLVHYIHAGMILTLFPQHDFVFILIPRTCFHLCFIFHECDVVFCVYITIFIICYYMFSFTFKNFHTIN